MVVENLNNKILVQKKRKLATPVAIPDKPVAIPDKCDPSEGGYSDESLIYNLCKKCNNDNDYYRVYDPDGSIYGNGKGFVQCFDDTTKKNFYLNKTGDTTTNRRINLWKWQRLCSMF